MARKPLTESTKAILGGHSALRARLSTSLRGERAAHAYLFSGPSGIGKTAVALEFARLLLCDQNDSEPCEKCPQCEASRQLQHPDLHLIFPYPPKLIKAKKSSDDSEEIDEAVLAEKTADAIASLAADPFAPAMIGAEEKSSEERVKLQSHSIRLLQIRALLRKVARKAFQASRKVYVLFHSETMNVQAQNALLKALEEPPPDGYFILVSESDQEMLPTIRSRCQLIRMGKLDAEVISSALEGDGVDTTQAHIAAQLANGSFVRARELAKQDLNVLQDDVINFLAESAQCNPLALPATIQRVQERLASTDRSYFDFLNLFLRDAALYHTLGEAADDKLVFHKLKSRIAKIAKAYPDADFEAAMIDVDKSAEYISLGYTAELVLYALSIRIHDALGKRAPAGTAKQTG